MVQEPSSFASSAGSLISRYKPCLKAAAARSLTSVNQHCKRIAQDKK